MPPNTQDEQILLLYLLHMSEKVASRLRRHGLQAQKFYLGLRCADGWLSSKQRSITATDDGHQIMALCRQFLAIYWHGQGIHQVQVTALDPRPARGQLDMFSQQDEMNEVNCVMDSINQRYGEFTLAPARLLNRSSMPNVIAPAWKPYGHRQTI